VVENVVPTVVYISVEYLDTSFFFQTVTAKSGSGVILSPDGYILTNNHVVGDARSIDVLLPDDEHTYHAEVVGVDPLSDLAVIKIEGRDFPTASFADTSTLRIGDWVIAIGSALGLEGGPTVTAGIVSNLNRSFTIGESDYYDVIQTSAAINPGNSGGPLVDLEGKVVGINTFIISGAQNIGFAVNTSTARRVYEELVQYGRVIRPYLGATLRTLTPSLATDLGLPVERGVLLWNVAPNGPAATEGLKNNDVITSFEGQEVDEASELIKLLWRHNVGDSVKVTFWRGDKEAEASITLAERPEGSQ
jgi:serine protease Do